MSRSDGYDSSSDEESMHEFQSHLNIPSMNIVNQRMNQKKKSNRGEGNSKKFMGNSGNKMVRFPDSYSPRQSMVTNSSTNNSSDFDEMLEESEIDPRLPSFSAGINREDVIYSSDSEADVDDSQFKRQLENPDHLDPDEYSASDDEVKTGTSQGSSKSQRSRKLETDITDQRKTSTSSTSSKASLKETPGGIKGILRRMTLTNRDRAGSENAFDRPGELSNSDTFIGKIFSSGNGGLSGGGMVPGGSKKENPNRNDEETNVGMDDEEGIEMKRLDVDLLNEHAQNLIAAHVPGFKSNLPSMENSGSHSGQTLVQEGASHEGNGDGGDKHKQQTGDNFYTPNPEFYLRGNSDSEDEYLVEAGHEGVAPPSQVQAGVLSSLLQLYQNPQNSRSTSSFGASTLMDEQDSFLNTESKSPSRNTSTMDFTKLRSNILRGPQKMSKKIHDSVSRTSNFTNNQHDQNLDGSVDELPSFQNAKPRVPKKPIGNANIPYKLHKKLRHHKKAQDKQLKITVHIADILQRQRFIIRMCKALMLFGAPTHRLEEYMVMTSRVLEIDGQFVYLPGCMIISFGDAATRTSEVHLVRCNQGLNLSKLSDVHKIYKSVIHDLVSVEEAAKKVEDILKTRNRYPPWVCVLLYGLGSSFVCPFAFGGGWFDIPVTFGVGLCVGYLQFYVSSKSNLYSSVFEVTSSIVVSFIARGIGSINSGNTFCFAAIAQGSLALILPGYIILCGSMELQSRNLVAGSVRMFYAIIYSLFLGFGITLGAALYGWVDKNSTSQTKCDSSHTVDAKFRILFVPCFAVCLSLINQARFNQLPVMVVIASTGYVGTYFAGRHFSDVSEFTSCIGAFIVGILGNLYSRVWKGMAVSAMLPAIFVQVPSGIASQSSLLAGIASADKITNSTSSKSSSTSSNSLSFGASMVEVSIGISVGLFAATLCVYPFGKKKTGLFTL